MDGASGLLCVTHCLYSLPALLARGDEFRMNPWRTFLEIRQGAEFPGDSSTTPWTRSGGPSGGAIIPLGRIISFLCTTGYRHRYST